MSVDHVIAADYKKNDYDKEKEILDYIKDYSPPYTFVPWGYWTAKGRWSVLSRADDTHSIAEIDQESRDNVHHFDPYIDYISGMVIGEDLTYPEDFNYEKFCTVYDAVNEETSSAIDLVASVGIKNITDNYLQKIWSSSKGLVMVCHYAWGVNFTVQQSVESFTSHWRKAADRKKELNGGRWVGLHDSYDDPGANLEFPDREELLLTVIGPLAHGAIGSALWVFDYNDDPRPQEEKVTDLFETTQQRRDNVANAFNRLNQLEGYLTGYSYEGYGESPSTFPPGADHLKNIGTEQPEWLNMFNVGFFAKTGDWEGYMICSRNPDVDRAVTCQFNYECEVKLDGVSKGQMSQITIDFPRGDARFLELQKVYQY